MNLSDAGLQKIANHEGVVHFVYDDATGAAWSKHGGNKGRPTIGVGHLIAQDAHGNLLEYAADNFTLTNVEIMALFRKDLCRFIIAVNSIKAPLNQNQFDALVSLAFNIGVNNFKTSSLVRLINQYKYEAAAEHFAAWCHDDRGVNAGLVKRRAEEAALFRTPV